MELIKGSTTLVLVGIWNPAILNPDWLAKHGFKKEGQVEATLEFTSIPGLPPRLTMEGLVIEPQRTRVLIIIPGEVNDASLESAEKLAVSILGQLPHTPIQAVGENFEFVEAVPTDDQLAVFTAANDLPKKCDFIFDAKSQRISDSIEFEGRILNLTRSLANGQLNVAFNFHYGVESATDAIKRITDNHSFKDNYLYAKRVIKHVLGVELVDNKTEDAVHA